MIMSEAFDQSNKNKSYENYFEEHFFILNFNFCYYALFLLIHITLKSIIFNLHLTK